MRSWALVCDVYFLEPQARREGESAQEFAERVQRLIADRARLKVAPWDGYLKYYNLGEKVMLGKGFDTGVCWCARKRRPRRWAADWVHLWQAVR